MAQDRDDQVALDSTALDELNSAETRTLFDTADKLSSLGVGRIVNLPQIIVVGDQSSGKSSVLEAISHVHFPVQGGVCTRFATELILRPGRRRRVTAAVHFADNAQPSHTLQVDDFKQADIDHIIGAAKEQMGLSDTGRSFSKDILRLEIEGPDMYPLTLVDLPGIFHAATASQSTEGKTTVMELVDSYMKKKNSIILAIISANNQLANQAVMEEVTKHDPAKQRTLGVITKPDLLPLDSSNEKEYLQLVQGRDTVNNLELGWHVLRNRADYEEHLGSRDSVEESFFSSGSWASISAANRGVAALRKKLSKILHGHIKNSLPAVLEDVRTQLCKREDELARLGEPRLSPEDMRTYLIEIAVRFQSLVNDGVQGRYNDPFFGGFDGTDRKLRAQLRNFSRLIRHVLLVHGSAYEWVEPGKDVTEQEKVPHYLQDFLERNADYNLPDPQVLSRPELVARLERQAAANQGTEFPGYANKDLVTQLFQEQAAPWESIAKQHLNNVTSTVKTFVEMVVHDIIGPSNTHGEALILLTHVDPFFDLKEKALASKLREILRPFKEGYAMPLDADFHEAMERRAADLAAKTNEDDDDDDDNDEDDDEDEDEDDDENDDEDEDEDEDDAGRRTHPTHLSRKDREFGTKRIIDTVQTFYDMALRTFTENLINLAIESCLIRELFEIISPRLVSEMSDQRLAEFAAESEEVRDRRTQLRRDVKLLKEGLEHCRRHQPREIAVRSSASPSAGQQKSARVIKSTENLFEQGAARPEVPGKVPALRATTPSNPQPPSLNAGIFGSTLATTNGSSGSSSGVFDNLPKKSVVNFSFGHSSMTGSGASPNAQGLKSAWSADSNSIPGAGKTAQSGKQNDTRNREPPITATASTTTSNGFNFGKLNSSQSRGGGLVSSPNLPKKDYDKKLLIPPSTKGRIADDFRGGLHAEERLQHISFRDKFRGFSPEELRLAERFQFTMD